ncbi:MAG: hypothetical protein SGPRY_005742, partial [Prymnesium sp.]
VWHWLSSRGWTPYDAAQSAMLEKARREAWGKLQIDSERQVDLVRMRQVPTNSHHD